MADSYTLGDLWVFLRGNSKKLKEDIQQAGEEAEEEADKKGKEAGKKFSLGMHSALRGAHFLGRTLSGQAGAAGLGAGLGGFLGGSVGTAVGAGAGEILDLGAQFSQKANPAAMVQLNQAFDDLQATIGQNFVPVVQAGTETVKLLADGVETVLTPALQPLREAAEAAAHALAWVREKLEAIGALAPSAKAARPVEITSQSAYLRKAYQTAGAGAASHAQKTEGWLSQISSNSGKLVDMLGGAGGGVGMGQSLQTLVQILRALS